ncbi:hypothetical protein F8388_023223 [Cannabis sativa]|uniref:ADP/ATP translocase n=1 Tax=Cannabis sativa TaxID=3483 RepID=A0A7J6HFX4_CANSA|nr:hypothetical protein F8388_023223 [Cannabis sativa]
MSLYPDFAIGGVAALILKSLAAPIERVKLLLQNQGEMVKRGQLRTPYMGVGDYFQRVFRDEDYARTRLGTDAREHSVNGQHQFKGLIDVYCKTLSSDRIMSISKSN